MKNIPLPVVRAALLALLASPACATTTIAADIDGGLAVGRAASSNGATLGVTMRGGHEFRLTENFFLGPEGGSGMMVISDADGAADGSSVLPSSNPALYRMFGGLRGGFLAGDGGRVVPSLFVRGGYAWISGSGEGAKSAQAPMLDVGLAVDYAVASSFRIGGHAGFETLWAEGYGGPFTGIHAGIAFALMTHRPGREPGR
ncbi:hypothetical protein BE08_17420 [Sorangium cellulosum]|uniref:Secreted protein n=1 Tax=Sorangium cellulosum TaxID=56 RepID=A0A150PUL9_SORCE|nr:hypothetical protein BE08_17420 [Sorangium cellulosum]